MAMRKTIARAKLIAQLNKQIAEAPSVEQRLSLQMTFSTLLNAMGCCRGFGYVEWNNGGYEKWRDAGRPDDNREFFGDQSLIEYI
jgi:hypothetical protein